MLTLLILATALYFMVGISAFFIGRLYERVMWNREFGWLKKVQKMNYEEVEKKLTELQLYERNA